MEVFLYNSTVCRLCGEENDSGTLLYSPEENTQNLSEIINTYLPIKVILICGCIDFNLYFKMADFSSNYNIFIP